MRLYPIQISIILSHSLFSDILNDVKYIYIFRKKSLNLLYIAYRRNKKKIFDTKQQQQSEMKFYVYKKKTGN
jgi:hypothetical protein